MAFKFEKLEVWQLAIEIADDIHKLTKTFLKDKMFVLTSHIKRAADSISLNIAEGSTGQSNAEQCRFLGYSQRSALEVVNCLYLAKRREYIQDENFRALYDKNEKKWQRSRLSKILYKKDSHSQSINR